MELVFLGTGGSVPTRNRNTSSTAVRVGSEVLLFDCGEGTQRQLMSSTVSFMKISRIFITHLHGDHFLGLPGLIQSMNFAGRLEPLAIYGPPGTEKLVEEILHLGYFQAVFQVSGHDVQDHEVVPGKGYRSRRCAPNTPYHRSDSCWRRTFGLAVSTRKGRWS